MTLPLALALIGFASAVIAVAIVSAVVELALRNYRLSAIASGVAIACIPLVLIGTNCANLATQLVAHS